MKPIYFHIIWGIKVIKMHSFCQPSAHYAGFSFLSEGLMLGFLYASVVGEFLGGVGWVTGSLTTPGVLLPCPQGWWVRMESAPTDGAMHLPWGELEERWGGVCTVEDFSVKL